jgi:hypothetical protein
MSHEYRTEVTKTIAKKPHTTLSKEEGFAVVGVATNNMLSTNAECW